MKLSKSLQNLARKLYAGWTEEGWDPDINEEDQKPKKEKPKDIEDLIQKALDGIGDYYNWEKEKREQFKKLIDKMNQELSQIASDIPQSLKSEYKENTPPIKILQWEFQDDPLVKEYLKKQPEVIDQAIALYKKLKARLQAFGDQIMAEAKSMGQSNIFNYAFPRYWSTLHEFQTTYSYSLPKLKEKLEL